MQRNGSSERLHSMTRLLAQGLGLLVLLACAALAISTTLSRRLAAETIGVNETLRASDAIRINLSRLGREALLAYVTQNPSDQMTAIRSEGELWASLGRAHAVVRRPQQRELLEKAEQQIDQYLVRLKETEAERRPYREVVASSQPEIQAALDTLHELSRMGFDETSAAEKRLLKSELIEKRLGIAIAITLFAGFVTVVLVFRRKVLAPLIALGRGIDRFAGGDRAARVSPIGPTELRQTAVSFNEMAAHIEQQHQDLLTFLAGVAHDLRNPLAAMRMALHYLDGHVPEEKRRRTTELLDRQVTRLERMVGDFLDAARIEGGHLELQLERCDLRPLAEEAVELYRATSPDHRISLFAPARAVEVRCDPERLAQVLNNLVSNAIKYSPRGGDVKVTVRASDDEAVVAVSDSGIGISGEDQTQIFEPFRRTGASRETAPGVGLGLSVARQIIEAHGGVIEVESTLGIGSTFRVRLPLA